MVVDSVVAVVDIVMVVAVILLGGLLCVFCHFISLGNGGLFLASVLHVH